VLVGGGTGVKVLLGGIGVRLGVAVGLGVLDGVAVGTAVAVFVFTGTAVAVFVLVGSASDVAVADDSVLVEVGLVLLVLLVLVADGVGEGFEPVWGDCGVGVCCKLASSVAMASIMPSSRGWNWGVLSPGKAL
jgi:hypothetical protein